jgi:PhnB protein
MNAINAYLNFDGNTREAMTFYAETLGAEVKIQSNKEAGMAEGNDPDRTIHAHLHKGPIVLMASDSQPGVPFIQGNNFYICVDCENRPEIERLFTAFSSGGRVLMELQDTFWGARFGMCIDKYGVGWMFNLETGKKG